MKVPLLDLAAQHEPLHADLLKAIERVLQCQTFILGPEVEGLERTVAAYSQARFAVGVSSGTDALLISLMALDVQAGDDVVTSPYSFFATAGVIVRLGARPVFADIDPKTFNIQASKIESVLTPKTKALLPVHLFGQCAEMPSILEIAMRHRLPVIEDAAQALGAEDSSGRRAGSAGDAGCFSFFPSKNLGALGDAGMVVTNDEERADKIRALRVHGAKRKYYHEWVGGNFRLDALQAAVLSTKLPHLDGWTRRRQENALRYEALFQQSGLLEKELVTLPRPAHSLGKIAHAHIYNQFVIRAKRRDALKAFLNQREVATEIYYPVPLHLQKCFQYLGYREGDFPESEKAAHETLALPIYPELTPPMQEAVVKGIEEFYAS